MNPLLGGSDADTVIVCIAADRCGSMYEAIDSLDTAQLALWGNEASTIVAQDQYDKYNVAKVRKKVRLQVQPLWHFGMMGY